jgi:hypothetical protein
LYQNPWSEFAILHFQILVDGDRLANFVQWFSMVGSIIGVSLLAKELQATLRGQIFAAVVSATIPMGILQGSSTQNDYVASFWLVCLVYFVMLMRKKVNLLNALGMGLALGLYIFTKATAYIFAFPFLVWLGLSCMKLRDRKQLSLIALALLVAFVINLGHYVRNYDLFSNPLGDQADVKLHKNEAIALSTVASNVMRNVGLHLGLPFSRFNKALGNAVSSLHKLFKIPLNDERATWADMKFKTPQLSFHEDYAGNPLHLLLIVISLMLYIFQRPRERESAPYIFSILLAFLLFCGYLKWQPWHSRLHLPLFVLFSPFVGLMISRIRSEKLANIFVALLIVTALPWALNNTSRPVIGKKSIFVTSRIEQYFSNRPSIAERYIKSAQHLLDLHCSKIGLIIGSDKWIYPSLGLDNWEYPLWVLLREQESETVSLEHVNVTNISKLLYDENDPRLNVCAIFAVNPNLPNSISIGDVVYWQERIFHSAGIYR